MIRNLSDYINKNLKKILTILLVLINVYGIEKRYIPWFTDEFGYWASAALFRGCNWNNVMNYSGYYGFGYGLVLALLVKIPNIRMRYYCAEILNIIFIVLIYMTLVRIFSVLVKEKKSVVLTCAVSMLYPYIIVFAHVTQAEIFLTFLYISSVHFLICFYEDKKIKHIVLLVICSFMMFSVHLRSLVAVLSLLISLLCILFSEKKAYKKIIVTIVFIIIALFVVWKVKDVIVQILYNVPLEVAHKDDKQAIKNTGNNSITMYLWILSQFKNLDTLKLLIKSVEGKVFYAGIATFSLVFSATYFLLKKIFTKDYKYAPVYIYILMSYWGQVILTSISMYSINRFDHLLYGRYSEAFILPLIVYGLYSLIEHEYGKNHYFFNMLILLLMACDLYNYVKNQVFNGCMNMQISGIAGLNIFATVDIRVVYTLIAVLLVSCVMVFMIFVKLKQGKLVLLLIAMVWFCMGQNTLNQNLYNGYWTAEQMENMAMEIKDADGKIYYLLTTDERERMDSVWRSMLYLQYMLVDKMIYPIDESGVDSIEKGAFLVVAKNMQDYTDYIKYDKTTENELFVLIEK